MARSYVLLHRVTGMPLPGYQVRSAEEHEIAAANQRLKAKGSEYRLVPDVHQHLRHLPQEAVHQQAS
jgi:hypothetical protein